MPVGEGDLPPSIEGRAASEHWRAKGAKRRFGICVPLFSLRSENDCGVGDIGDLFPLVDWCREIGASVIQLLPLNDMGMDGVPYAALSAFAMDPVYISLHHLDVMSEDANLSAHARAVAANMNMAGRVDYQGVRSAKMEFLSRALRLVDGVELRREFDRFRAENEWLDGYLTYRVIKEIEGFSSWEKWTADYPDSEINGVLDRRRDLVDLHLYSQWVLDRQLRDAAEYAREAGVLLMGDVPILVSRDSADVWETPGYFRLDTSAGAPPDMYSSDGQNWGFPTFDRDAMRADGFKWWRARLAHAERYFDLYRIDHVVGFFRIWTLNFGAPNGREGWFEPRDEAAWGDHGREIMRIMLESTTMLPLAEDLGTIPAICRETLRDLGICGLKVQRWERRWEGDGDFIPPGEYEPVSMATFSTHDTEVLADWWESSDQWERQRLHEAIGRTGEAPSSLGHELHRDLVRWLSGAGSMFYVLMLQDLLAPFGLLEVPPAEQRVNLPGTVNDANWTWRCPITIERLLSNASLAQGIREMIGPDRRPHPETLE